MRLVRLASFPSPLLPNGNESSSARAVCMPCATKEGTCPFQLIVTLTTAVRASPMEEEAALPARPEAEVVASGASHKNNHARNRRISVVAASYTHSDPEVAATQRAQLSAIQSRSSSFRGFSEDHLDMLFPLLTIIEVRVARVHPPKKTHG